MASPDFVLSTKPSRIPLPLKGHGTSLPFSKPVKVCVTPAIASALKNTTLPTTQEYSPQRSVRTPLPPNWRMEFLPYAPVSPPEDIYPHLEPLTPEMKVEVRAALERYYHSYREEDMFPREMKNCWMREPLALELGGSKYTKQLDSKQLRTVCNKSTSLYSIPATHTYGRCPSILFGGIYKEWFRCHDGKPNIEFGHFFASPVPITSTGPTTLDGILDAHKSLCDQASSLLSKLNSGELDGPGRGWPSPQHLMVLPLYWAIIVVLDELAPDPGPEPDGSASLDRLLREQNVLLVLTGDDSNLSAPINFESIRARSLPLARNDIPVNPEIDAVRVSLATAVRFIADLQQREEMAFPNLRDYSVIDQSISPCTQNFGGGNLNADAYAGMVMQRVEENGINNVLEAYDAVVRVKAARRGEVRQKTFLFNPNWK